MLVSTRSTPIVVLAVWLQLAMPVLGALHFVAQPHARCPNGEGWVHAGHPGHNPTGVPEPGRHIEHDHEGHDPPCDPKNHCAVRLWTGTAHIVVLSHNLPALPVSEFAPRLASPRTVVHGWTLPLYRIAPKQSPPGDLLG